MMTYFTSLPDYFKGGRVLPSTDAIHSIDDITAHYPPNLLDSSSNQAVSEADLQQLARVLNDIANNKAPYNGILPLAELIRSKRISFMPKIIGHVVLFLATFCKVHWQSSNKQVGLLARDALIQLQLIVAQYPTTRSLILDFINAVPLNTMATRNQLLNAFSDSRKELDAKPLVKIIKEILEEENTQKHYNLLSNFFLELPFLQHIFILDTTGLSDVDSYLEQKVLNNEQSPNEGEKARLYCMMIMLKNNGFFTYYKMGMEKGLRALCERIDYIPGLYHLDVEPKSLLFKRALKSPSAQAAEFRFDNIAIKKAAKAGYRVAQTCYTRAHLVDIELGPPESSVVNVSRLKSAIEQGCYAAAGYFFYELNSPSNESKENSRQAIKAGDIFGALLWPDVAHKGIDSSLFLIDGNDRGISYNFDLVAGVFSSQKYHHVLEKYKAAGTYHDGYTQRYRETWLSNKVFLVGPVLQGSFSGEQYVDGVWGALAYLIQDFVKKEYISDFCKRMLTAHGKMTDKEIEAVFEEEIEDGFFENIRIVDVAYALSPSVIKIFDEGNISLAPLTHELKIATIRQLLEKMLLVLRVMDHEVEHIRRECVHQVILKAHSLFLENKLYESFAQNIKVHPIEGMHFHDYEFSLKEAVSAGEFNFKDSSVERPYDVYYIKVKDKESVSSLCSDALSQLRHLHTVDFQKIKQQLLFAFYETEPAKIRAKQNPVRKCGYFMTALLEPFTNREPDDDFLNWFAGDDEKKPKGSNNLKWLIKFIKNQFTEAEALEFWPADLWKSSFSCGKNDFFNIPSPRKQGVTYRFNINVNEDFLSNLKYFLIAIAEKVNAPEIQEVDVNFISEQKILLMRFFIEHSIQYVKVKKSKSAALASLNQPKPGGPSAPPGAGKSGTSKNPVLQEAPSASASSSSNNLYDAADFKGLDRYCPRPLKTTSMDNFAGVKKQNSNSQQETVKSVAEKADEDLSSSVLGKVEMAFIPPAYSKTSIEDEKRILAESRVEECLKAPLLRLLSRSLTVSYFYKLGPLDKEDWLRVSSMLRDWIDAWENNGDLSNKKPIFFEKIKSIFEAILLMVTQGMCLNISVQQNLKSLLEGRDPGFSVHRRIIDNTLEDPVAFIHNMKESWMEPEANMREVESEKPRSFSVQIWKQMERLYHLAFKTWLGFIREKHAENNTQMTVRYGSLGGNTLSEEMDDLLKVNIDNTPLSALLERAESVIKLLSAQRLDNNCTNGKKDIKTAARK